MRLTQGIDLENHAISQDQVEKLNEVLDTFSCKILDYKQVNDSQAQGERQSNIRLQRSAPQQAKSKKGCKC